MKLIKKIFKNKTLNKSGIKLFVSLHNFSYKAISQLAVIENKGLHPKHRIMNYHKFFVNNIKQGSIVLDIGCSNGALAYDVAKKAKKVVAVDMSKENIKVAKKRYNKDNIHYVIGDVTKIDFAQKFDCIVLSNVLEHIKDRVSFLRKIRSLSEVFLIRVPLIERDWLTLYKKEKKLKYKLDKTHYIEYTIESFKKEIKEAGLRIKDYSIRFGEIWGVMEK